MLVAEGGNPDNLRFPGYFMANGRASLLTHQRSENTINHFWFDVVGDDLVLRPVPSRSIVENIPDGALVVVGNFRRDR